MASTSDPRADESLSRDEYRDRSRKNTSNIDSASTTNNTAIPALNQGDALTAPNARDVSTTIRPSAPYTTAIAPPYAAPSKRPRLRDTALLPAPRMARLTGISGRTQGVRLSA